MKYPTRRRSPFTDRCESRIADATVLFGPAKRRETRNEKRNSFPIFFFSHLFSSSSFPNLASTSSAFDPMRSAREYSQDAMPRVPRKRASKVTNGPVARIYGASFVSVSLLLPLLRRAHRPPPPPFAPLTVSADASSSRMIFLRSRANWNFRLRPRVRAIP